MSTRHVYETRVRPEWIDHNGHMNVAYFVLAFDEATDAVYESWGLGLDYPSQSGCSVFTLGMNVDYCSELFVDDPIRIETDLIGVDAKRIHYFHRMYNAKTDQLAAHNECLCMNVDLAGRKSTPFSEDILNLLMAAKHIGTAPDGFGRKLAIRRDRQT